MGKMVKNSLRLGVFLLAGLGVFDLNAQNRNNWLFGVNAGVSFSTDPPTVLSNIPMNAGEGCAVQNDENGNLLFYTNGQNVWDRNHGLMPNGFGLKGSNNSVQPAVCFPRPGVADQYYIFTTPSVGFGSDVLKGLNYNIVDLSPSVNGGLGDVVDKNQDLNLIVCEKLAAIKRCNDDDGYWVLVHDFGPDSNGFYAYPVDVNGVGEPVVSNVGHTITQSTSTVLRFEALGELQFSPRGDKVISTSPVLPLEMYDFDIETGILSNPLTFGDIGTKSACFSPDGTKVYVSLNSELVQYDLSAEDVLASRYALSSNRTSHGLQVAPDGTIYCSARLGSASFPLYFLDAIYEPNESGAACDYQINTISIPRLGSTVPLANLPNFPVVLMTEGTSKETDIFTCDGDTIPLCQGNVSASHLWNTGETSECILALTPGLYYDDVTYDGCTYRDTFNVIGPPEHPTYSEVLWCPGDTTIVHSNIEATSYLWSTGDITDTTFAVDTGYIYLDYEYRGCDYRDTFRINNLLDNKEGLTEVLYCEGATGANVEQKVLASSYLWNTGEVTQNIVVPDTGLYYVDVDWNGCMFRDSFDVVLKELFPRRIDTMVCNLDEIVLEGGLSTEGYLWSNGSITMNTNVTSSGEYILTKGNEGCIYNDTFLVDMVNTYPQKTVIRDCFNEYAELQSRESQADYTWSNGATDSAIVVGTSGNYTVLIIQDGCETLDSFEVYVNQPWRTIDLSIDSIIELCEREETVLELNQANTTYEWEDGSVSASRAVTGEGLYWVSATNECGTQYDSVWVEEKECPCQLFIPEAFTPNNDGDNDEFIAVTDCGLKVYEMTIFDRWGKVLFNTETFKPWDGRFNDKELPSGAYSYSLLYQHEFEIRTEKRIGTVFLLP